MAEPGTSRSSSPPSTRRGGSAPWSRASAPRDHSREVLVVDDGSTRRDRGARRGGGRARGAPSLQQGQRRRGEDGHPRGARARSCCSWTPTASTIPTDAPRLIEPIGVHDLVIGARSARDQSVVRALGNAVFQSPRVLAHRPAHPRPHLRLPRRAARPAARDPAPAARTASPIPTTSCLALPEGRATTWRSCPITARARVGTSKIRVLRDGVRFLLIIFKIVTLYSPLRGLLPDQPSSSLAGWASPTALWNVQVHGKIPMGAALLHPARGGGLPVRAHLGADRVGPGAEVSGIARPARATSVSSRSWPSCPSLAYAPALWRSACWGPATGGAALSRCASRPGRAGARGELPAWNPAIFGGTPLLAAYRPARFFPPMRGRSPRCRPSSPSRRWCSLSLAAAGVAGLSSTCAGSAREPVGAYVGGHVVRARALPRGPPGRHAPPSWRRRSCRCCCSPPSPTRRETAARAAGCRLAPGAAAARRARRGRARRRGSPAGRAACSWRTVPLGRPRPPGRRRVAAGRRGRAAARGAPAPADPARRCARPGAAADRASPRLRTASLPGSPGLVLALRLPHAGAGAGARRAAPRSPRSAGARARAARCSLPRPAVRPRPARGAGQRSPSSST